MPRSFHVKTSARTDMVDITAQIQAAISESGKSDGVCTVFIPHTTAGIVINEGADPDVCNDILAKLNEMVPPDAGYQHTEGNADSHIKTALVGTTASLIVENGRLVLGTWQKIFFCEFDGPRSRQVYIKI
ncbi:MAG: YjbQ family protein [Deltaproteobacteria bacterium]|nr:YjbQ family protein [Deltaproteobacteria bacterium]